VPDAVQSIGVTEVTYYRWRREYGGLQMDQVKRMKDLELENQRLRKAVSETDLGRGCQGNWITLPSGAFENFGRSFFVIHIINAPTCRRFWIVI